MEGEEENRVKLTIENVTGEGSPTIDNYIMILLRFACILWLNLYFELLYLRCHVRLIT